MNECTSDRVANDLKTLNLKFLMFARETISHFPMESAYIFGLNSEQLKKISSMSVEEIIFASESGRSLIKIDLIEKVSDFPSGLLASLEAC
ncbi:hypothetical protein [Methylomonas sp. AM2-LC]|uniref:hypothetical protein n=1 Tax=Methylomonas sp. AM2-LC TaxID=3153301 RepID=UPI003267D6BD